MRVNSEAWKVEVDSESAGSEQRTLWNSCGFMKHVIRVSCFLKFTINRVLTREEPPNRLAKMGAMPTPFRSADRNVEDTPPLQAEREEPRSETPPGNHIKY